MIQQASYTTDLSRAIGVLQHLQALLPPTPTEPTLADVVSLVNTLQHECGVSASLEDTIQHLVSRQVEEQLLARRSRRVAAQEVAA